MIMFLSVRSNRAVKKLNLIVDSSIQFWSERIIRHGKYELAIQWGAIDKTEQPIDTTGATTQAENE